MHRTEGCQLTFWMCFLPTEDASLPTRHAFLDDLLVYLRPFGASSVSTSEHRTYRLTVRGLSSLHAAITQRRVGLLTFNLGDRLAPSLNGLIADVFLDFNLGGFPDAAYTLYGRLEMIPEAEWAAIRERTAMLLRRWSTPLHAASAWVSDQAADLTYRTAHEEAHHLFSPGGWQALQRYGRGAFWGTGLGPDLCRRVGGVDHILAEAPVAFAEQVGDGVWMQLGPAIPASATDLARLTEFLAPILFWTDADLMALRPPARTAEHAATSSLPAFAALPSEATIPIPVHNLEYDVTIYPGHPGSPLPLEEAVLERDLSLHIHMERHPNRAQQQALLGALNGWVHDVEEAAGTGIGFRRQYPPSLDVAGRALRVHVEAGDLGSFETVRRLLHWLAAVPGVAIRRIAIGDELVG